MKSSQIQASTVPVKIIGFNHTLSQTVGKGTILSNKVSSRNRLYKIEIDTCHFQYRVKGIARRLYDLWGLNTWVEVPSNTIIYCQVKHGLFLYITVQEYITHASAIRIIRLKPIFIPNWWLALRVRNKILSIINRNKNLPNSESHFFYKAGLSALPYK